MIHERACALTDGPPNEGHVAFGVVDLARACDDLRQGVDLLLPPDADGRLLELSQT